MEDTPKAAPSPLSAQEQARIRRERRQAKVREGGNSRLSRITATQGTDFRKAELEEAEAAAAAAAAAATATRSSPPVGGGGDPPEVDISQLLGGRASPHEAVHFAPSKSPEDELREAFMLDQLYGQRHSQAAAAAAGGGGGGLGGDASAMEGHDPLMQLLQQISGAGGGFPGMEGLSPGMMSGIMGGNDGPAQTADPSATNREQWGMWWAVVHALAALVLSLWALRSNPMAFDGSQMTRIESANLARSEKPQLFWYFAVMELLLQSGRFMLEKGQPPQGSMLTTVAGFLPPPFSTYLTTLARYSVFLWTILADAGIVIFALGVASWWNS